MNEKQEEIGWIIFGISGIFVGFFWILEPSLIWLDTGYYPKRDLFWLFGSGCDTSIWSDIGSGASDACRIQGGLYTEMVGLNKMINWLFDLDLGYLWFFFFIIWNLFRIIK